MARIDLFPAASDVQDGAGHVLVTTYAVLRPDRQWSLMIVNKDQENAHAVEIAFDVAGKAKSEYFTGPVSVVTFWERTIPVAREREGRDCGSRWTVRRNRRSIRVPGPSLRCRRRR